MLLVAWFYSQSRRNEGSVKNIYLMFLYCCFFFIFLHIWVSSGTAMLRVIAADLCFERSNYDNIEPPIVAAARNTL